MTKQSPTATQRHCSDMRYQPEVVFGSLLTRMYQWEIIKTAVAQERRHDC